MSIETQGGWWCDREAQPVVAERTVNRSGLRGVLADLFGEGWAPRGPWHCRNCGSPVRRMGAGEEWATAPAGQVPPWRERDREQLDIEQR